jgi:hypothetical protein
VVPRRPAGRVQREQSSGASNDERLLVRVMEGLPYRRTRIWMPMTDWTPVGPCELRIPRSGEGFVDSTESVALSFEWSGELQRILSKMAR